MYSSNPCHTVSVIVAFLQNCLGFWDHSKSVSNSMFLTTFYTFSYWSWACRNSHNGYYYQQSIRLWKAKFPSEIWFSLCYPLLHWIMGLLERINSWISLLNLHGLFESQIHCGRCQITSHSLRFQGGFLDRSNRQGELWSETYPKSFSS